VSEKVRAFVDRGEDRDGFHLDLASVLVEQSRDLVDGPDVVRRVEVFVCRP